ncbi:Tti2 family protein [Aspergillus alliaceus]|uniref:Tti2 family protein n=1 Tax=Petromyces alliaceus TaxID=209559 RepID=UPI0012A3B80A|nr:uncharacterized protein BDW43DRAFT_306093 [Aspergillus alliaceus]KAB8239211.1 hypothetical protein BDW43DRAFT_306093 [Aspergillus alliaceus]
MEELRLACREAISQRHPTSTTFPEVQVENIALPEGLDQLWENVSSQKDASNLDTCESLLVAYQFLKVRGAKDLSSTDKDAANGIYSWASSAALPSPVYAQVGELSDAEKNVILEEQLRSRIALAVLTKIAGNLPIHEAENVADVVIVLASFTSKGDPWTTEEAFASATTLLDTFISATVTDAENNAPFWSVIERILKERIRPLFAKTRNPAITSSGRKNFHPIPLPRFDASVLDPETKPWKNQGVYATTVLSWIIQEYKARSLLPHHKHTANQQQLQPTDSTHLETHFSLLVPPILALIDDDTTTFKTKGCNLLSYLLTPITTSKSPILHRTNLSSVFEDAIKQCLLSLPTITPEDDAISLLGEAYPALFTLQTTSYHNAPSPQASKQLYISRLTNTLRENLIPSFHHISSTNTTSSSSFASFPYPRLSSLLLDNMIPIIQGLGIHSTKYLQDLVPLLHDTLSNPFGPAHPPLLFSAVAVLRVVILNAHPRVWRWRGEVLGAVCLCWLHAVQEEKEIADREKKAGSSAGAETGGAVMAKLKKELRGTVYLLKFALENSVQADGGEGQVEAKENLAKELQELVNADESLGGLLLEDIDVDDGSFIGDV